VVQGNGSASNRKVPLTPEQASDLWERKCEPANGCRTACCYFEGSACENLRVMNTKTGRAVCRIYFDRFGEHKTVDGKAFRCVPFMVWLRTKPAPAKCGYAGVTAIDGVPVVRGMT